MPWQRKVGAKAVRTKRQACRSKGRCSGWTECGGWKEVGKGVLGLQRQQRRTLA